MADTVQTASQEKIELDIPDVTIAQFLTKGFREFPDRAAYHFMGLTHSFGELDDMSARFARFLLDKGCQPGDVVGFHLPNLPQALIAIFGAFRAGCRITGVSPLLTPIEIAHQLNDSRAKVLVTMDALYENVYFKAGNETPDVKHVVVTGIADMLPAIKRFLGKLLKKIPTGNIEQLPGKDISMFMDVLKTHPPRCPAFKTDRAFKRLRDFPSQPGGRMCRSGGSV